MLPGPWPSAPSALPHSLLAYADSHAPQQRDTPLLLLQGTQKLNDFCITSTSYPLLSGCKAKTVFVAQQRGLSLSNKQKKVAHPLRTPGQNLNHTDACKKSSKQLQAAIYAPHTFSPRIASSFYFVLLAAVPREVRAAGAQRHAAARQWYRRSQFLW